MFISIQTPAFQSALDIIANLILTDFKIEVLFAQLKSLYLQKHGLAVTRNLFTSPQSSPASKAKECNS
jgi:hypothetical protein